MSVSIPNQLFPSRQLVLASNNQGKLAEFKQLFEQANLEISVIPQGQLGIEDAVEDGLSFIENALIKARHASRISGLPAIADDSGLCVPILGGQPGIYSARFAQDEANFSEHKDLANNQKLLRLLKNPTDTRMSRLSGSLFACWHSCAMPMTRYPSLHKEFGKVKSCPPHKVSLVWL